MGDLGRTKWSIDEGWGFCCAGEIRMGLLLLEVADAMLMMFVVADLRWLVRKRCVRVGGCWWGLEEECLTMLRELLEGRMYSYEKTRWALI